MTTNGRFARMNGGPGATFFTLGTPAAAACSVTKWDRLVAALMASCLLHVAAVLAPALGMGGGILIFAPHRSQNTRTPSVLDVRLAETGRPAMRAAPTRVPRGVDLLPFPARLFRTADELTKQPRPRVKPAFNVPAPIFTPGKVILKVWIDALGNVVAVDVEESSVPDALAATAASAFRQTPFIPGEINGGRVATLMRIEVTYADGIAFSYDKRSATR
jgi:TonB family protein